MRVAKEQARAAVQPDGSTFPASPYPDGTFKAAHIPGADFLDLQGEFSDQNTKLRFMRPGTTTLVENE